MASDFLCLVAFLGWYGCFIPSNQLDHEGSSKQPYPGPGSQQGTLEALHTLPPLDLQIISHQSSLESHTHTSGSKHLESAHDVNGEIQLPCRLTLQVMCKSCEVNWNMFLDLKNWVGGGDHMIDISILTYEKSILNLCYCIIDTSYISYIHTCNSDMIRVFMYPSTSYRFVTTSLQKSFAMATRKPDRAAQWGPRLTFSVDILDVFKVHQLNNDLIHSCNSRSWIKNINRILSRCWNISPTILYIFHGKHFRATLYATRVESQLNTLGVTKTFQWDAVQVARRPRTAVCLTIDHTMSCCPSLPWFCPWI